MFEEAGETGRNYFEVQYTDVEGAGFGLVAWGVLAGETFRPFIYFRI